MPPQGNMEAPSSASKLLRRLLMGVEIFIGVGALWGGGALVVDPSGTVLGMPTFWLRYTPFRDYLVPGLLLLVFIGLGQLLAAGWLFARRAYAAELSALAGVVLIGWTLIEMYLLRTANWMQFTYLAFGLADVVLAGALRWSQRPMAHP